MVKPHHMMLGKRRHGHVFRILYVLRRKSIFEPHYYSIFRQKRRWSTTRCSIDGDTRALKLPFKICTMVRDWFWKHKKNFFFSPFFFFFFFFENVLEFAGIFAFLGVDYHFPWTVQTIVHWCPRYYERGRLSQIFFECVSCFLFGLLID